MYPVLETDPPDSHLTDYLTFPEETVDNTTSHPGPVKLSPWAKQWLNRKGNSTNVTSNTTREDVFISSTEPSPSQIFALFGVKQGQKRKASEMDM